MTVEHEAARTRLCLCFSKLDYCNSLLSGFSLYLLSRLQKVQNSAAKLVFKARKRDHVQSFLQALHWLLAQARIHYKLSTVSTFSPKLTHLLPISLTVSLCTPLPGDFVLLQPHGYFVSPMTENLWATLFLCSKAIEFTF